MKYLPWLVIAIFVVALKEKPSLFDENHEKFTPKKNFFPKARRVALFESAFRHMVWWENRLSSLSRNFKKGGKAAHFVGIHSLGRVAHFTHKNSPWCQQIGLDRVSEKVDRFSLWAAGGTLKNDLEAWKILSYWERFIPKAQSFSPKALACWPERFCTTFHCSLITPELLGRQEILKALKLQRVPNMTHLGVNLSLTALYRFIKPQFSPFPA